MIIDVNGKRPFEIRDSTGKEFKKIYDADGNLLFKNWNTIQGTPPIVFKGYNKSLKNYKIYGNTIQDGTPTPETPVEVQGCGVGTANLINIEQCNTKNVSKSSDGSYLVYSSGKWGWCIPTEIGKTYCVTVSVMNEYKNGSGLEIALCKGYRTSYKSAANTIALSLKSDEAYKIHTKTFTFTATDEWLTIAGMQTHVYMIMINEGSAALPYEPYGYKIPVTVSGENLATLIQGSYNANGEPNTIGNRVKTPLVPVEYGDVFVMTLNKWYFRNVAFFDESKNFIKFGNDISIVPYIYADVQNAKYISVILGDTKSGQGQGHNISPNYSPFRLEYKPITTPVYIGSEPLHKIGDYADYIDFERGVVVRNIKKIVSTGDENWVRYTMSATSPVERFTLSCGARPVTIISLICSHFIAGDGATGARFGGNYCDQLFFHINKTIASTVDEFKRYLQSQYSSGTPVTVWYVLAEPEEEPLENLSPIQTIKGTNILSTNTTIQPSEIYLKGKIKSLATHMLVDSSGNILLTSNNYQLVTKEE